MSKLAQAFSKYVINGVMHANGIVEKPDVIGAIFGQTEGLLGPDLDLRELQRTGRIGRIEVNVKSEGGVSSAKIIIPSSLDATETALIAAALETIDRIGPCTAEIKIENLEDSRLVKRDYIINRAKELLQKMQSEGVRPQEITEEIRKKVRISEISEFYGMPAGPEIQQSDSIIFVEGRADVINLLKHGIKNAVAIGGTSISDKVAEISKQKTATVFLDGDRGGDLIFKELSQIADLDYIARAPEGKEVEELSKKEIFKALRDKIAIEQINNNDQQANKNVENLSQISEKEKSTFSELTDNLRSTRAISILDRNMNILGKLPISEAFSTVPEVTGAYAIIFDGKINNKFIQLAEDIGVKYLIGMSKENNLKETDVILLTRTELQT